MAQAIITYFKLKHLTKIKKKKSEHLFYELCLSGEKIAKQHPHSHPQPHPLPKPFIF